MIKSKSEPSLFPPTPSLQQVHSATASRTSDITGVGQSLRRVPSLDQLPDAGGDADSQGLAPDHAALTLPPHLLDVAAVKTIVSGADLFDVAHNFTPTHSQAAFPQQFFDASAADPAALAEDATQAAAAIDLCPSKSLPLYIKPSVSLLPDRVRAVKGDVLPIPPACLRLPWHLELPPVVHTFTLKTEYPGKPGARHDHDNF
jgi:hypothetical protein